MKEKKELGEIGRREERREGRVKGRIVMVMMVMGCNSGGVKGEGQVGGAGGGEGERIKWSNDGSREKCREGILFIYRVNVRCIGIYC
ncbi:hypothetical protein BCD_1051 (plasmid) [Borrelia crocidurae DOU]|uniref:Variable outer membrane protein n=1 Tax=Borrelia crocidurae DOU TaxID=1293575 RepID=W5SJL5_9SPIR|nr:hypothetical protein BCD_1051 [Borrelia crocidurae DOU]